MIDTHAHLNFKRFAKNLNEVMVDIRAADITDVIVPGTDEISSTRAVALADSYPEIWAAVGIHPHHVYEFSHEKESAFDELIIHLSQLITHPRVVAVGEIGLDKYHYTKSKYETYTINDAFLNAQKKLFVLQLQLAIAHNKAVIIHNREAKNDLIQLLEMHWDERLRHKMVFHCCEPDDELLSFAQAHDIYIGVDGDVTYWKQKQDFIKNVPLEMLVLETDSPFLLPEPLKTQKKYPNTPATIPIIEMFIALLKEVTPLFIAEITTINARQLFAI